jgi:hypothetical protein
VFGVLLYVCKAMFASNDWKAVAVTRYCYQLRSASCAIVTRLPSE